MRRNDQASKTTLAMFITIFIMLAMPNNSVAQAGDSTKNISLPQRDEKGEIAQTLIAKNKFISIPSKMGGLSYHLKNDDDTFALSTGGSRVALFKLPDFVQPYTLKITSYCCFALKPVIFVPTGMFLDSALRSTHEVRETEFKLFPNSFSRAAHMGIDILIDESRKDDRYLLVYTRADYENKRLDPVVNNNINYYFIAMEEFKVSLKRSPYGKIILETSKVK